MRTPESHRELSPYAVYTIVQASRLRDAAKTAEPLVLIEGKAWAEAARQFQRAQEQNQTMVVLFAAAETTDGLTHWGRLVGVAVDRDKTGQAKTTATIEGVRTIRPKRALSELVLQRTGEPLSQDFIRPYALVRLPAFLLEAARRLGDAD